jgi:hypothetical protein
VETQANLSEGIMANHQNAASGHPDMDYAEHQNTYQLFLALTKWGTIGVIAIVVFMAVTLL